MKTLLIVRHAKADWQMPGQKDQDRPLINRGIKRTELISDFLKNKNINPDLIVASSAIRAAQTAKLLAKGLDFNESKIIFNPDIYHWSHVDLFDVFLEIPDDVNTMILVGHNPTLTDFSNIFLDHPIENLPTTGVVCISFDTNVWSDIRKSTTKTEFVIFPKMLQ